MTYPGLGGQQLAPLHSAPAAQLVPGVQPGTTGQIIATRVIIVGANGDLLVYSSLPPAAGNLIASISGAGGTDAAGNHFVSGVASYAATFAASLNAGFVQFYTGSLAGGWTARGYLETGSLGDIIILQVSGRTVQT